MRSDPAYKIRDIGDSKISAVKSCILYLASWTHNYEIKICTK